MNNHGLIIMLCRNGLSCARKCLPTLLAQSVPVDVLVVDNDSTDGTASFMRSQQVLHPNIQRMSMPWVESVAYCWNRGLEWAWQHSYREALVVNHDVELSPKTYKTLVPYLYSKEMGLVTGVGVDGDITAPTEGAISPHPDYACFMIARWAHQKVPFDERYAGAYFEDNDHHVRLHRAGIGAGCINLPFKHHRSSTLKHATKEERERIEQHYNRNQERFRQQYGCVPRSAAYQKLFSNATI